MSHTELLEKHLGIRLDERIRLLVDRHTQPRRYAAGQIVVHEGQRAPGVYLLLMGVVRGYYLDENGREATKCFAAQGDFFSTEGLRTSGPASFGVQCVTPCECLLLPYTLVESAGALQPGVAQRVAQLFTAEVARLEQRAKTVLLLDAQARYHQFKQEYPGLHSRVPLQYIASYIGVRPETLSRIRKKEPCN